MYTATISLLELFQQFPDEASARVAMEHRRWPHGVDCPHCHENKRIGTRKGGYYRCNACMEVFTVRTKSVMERSHIPLHKWIYGMYLLVTARKGVSSLQLSKEIGIRQSSAWFMLQRLREACNDTSGPLSGIVEIDETYLGGKEKNKHSSKQVKHSQGGANKTIVMGMKERGGKVKAQVINNTKTSTLQNVLASNVDRNTLLMTDELRGYKGVEFNRLSVNHSAREYVNGMAHTNGIESVWAVLKRGYNGTYHNWSAKHCHRYVNEFTFRLNEGNVKISTMDRIESMLAGAVGKRLTYKALIT